MLVTLVEVLVSACLLRDVRDGCCVIKVETCGGQLGAKPQELLQGGLLSNQKRVHSAPIQLVHERKRSHPVVRGMDTGITNHGLPSVL
jgi:hypothetical protein